MKQRLKFNAQFILTFSCIAPMLPVHTPAQEADSARDSSASLNSPSDLRPELTELPKVPRLIHRWELEPNLHVRWTLNPVPPPLKISMEILESGSQRQCVQIAETIIRCGPRGFADADGIHERLVARLKRQDTNASLKLALISAAIRVHPEPEYLEELWRLCSDDAARRFVERELCKTDSQIALPHWREAVQSRNLTDRMLAVKGIGNAGDASDVAALKELLAQPNLPLPLQHATARSLGHLVDSGLEPLAKELIESGRPNAELLAAYVLRRHTSVDEEIVKLILASTTTPAQLVLFENLIEFQPEVAQRLLPTFLEHPDPTGRRIALRFITKRDPQGSVADLRQALADQNEKTRIEARALLLRLSQVSELRPQVEDAVGESLVTAKPVGQEQACILAGEANFEAHCPELVNLLRSPDERVYASAAWALQRVADEPKILKAMEDFAAGKSKQMSPNSWPPHSRAAQLGYLFESLGRNRVMSAEKMLKRYIPKTSAPANARASAIFALGLLREDSQDARLARQLESRLHDDSDLNPERMIVKYVSAISLAKIAAEGSLKSVESHYDRPPSPIGLARAWAIERLSGEGDKASD